MPYDPVEEFMRTRMPPPGAGPRPSLAGPRPRRRAAAPRRVSETAPQLAPAKPQRQRLSDYLRGEGERPAGEGGGGRRRRPVVGFDLYMDAAQVRGELDRVNARWSSMKRAIAGAHDRVDEATRAEFAEAWRGWSSFYTDARGDFLAWSSNVDEARRWDQEGDAWRDRLTSLGVTAANPTNSGTVTRPGLLDGFGSVGLVAAGAIIAGIAVYAATR